MKIKNILFLSILGLVVTSCVSSKKFQDLEKQYLASVKKRDSLLIANQNLQADLADANTEIDVLNRFKNQLISDTTQIGSEIRNLRLRNKELQDYNALLEKNYADLLKGREQETTDLMNELKDARNKLQQREDSLDLMQAELDARAKRLKDLEDALAKKDQDVLDLKNKVLAALKGFENSGLSVEVKNGKVYVRMDDKLLFASGSTKVNANGVSALNELANVLASEKDINVMVEGHTDNVPLKGTGCNKDNWDLSVDRANAVTKIILANGDIDPSRITSAGRGEFFPLVKNDSPENRAKNRRTEIILTPDLSTLFDIMQ